MNNGLRDYLKSIGARTLTRENCPALVEYDRAMREEVIPAIERDMKAQRRAAHFMRLGIPDPLALAGEAGTAETPKRDSVHEHATAQPERPNPTPILPKKERTK